MNQTFFPFPYHNFMNLPTQIDQNFNSPLGFTFCPTIPQFPFMFNSDKNHSQSIAISEDSVRIDQNQLRIRLQAIFRKDKKKFYDICDQFIDLMGLETLCQNIQAMVDFIAKTSSEEITSKFDHKKNSNVNPTGQPAELPQKKNPLAIFTSQASFLSSIFSKDKLTVLLQVHMCYQKIQNFLNYLLISLQSFSSTNEKEEILMKDEIERVLFKYEKNVNKILEVTTQLVVEASDITGSAAKPMKEKGNMKSKSNRSMEGRELKELMDSNHIDPRIQQELNLKQYKRDLVMLKQKIKEMQISICDAMRKSFFSWYQKFQTILDSLREDLTFVCQLIEKAKYFEQSAEKYQITDFLLITRSKGIESMIFMEQAFKCIMIKLEDARLKLSHSVTASKRTRVGSYEKDKLDFAAKQQKKKEQIENMFKKFERMLRVRVDRKFNSRNYSLILFEDSESEITPKKEEKEKENQKENVQKSTSGDENENTKNAQNTEAIQGNKKQKSPQKVTIELKDSQNQDEKEEKTAQKAEPKDKKIRKDNKEDKNMYRKGWNIILQSHLRKKLDQPLQMNDEKEKLAEKPQLEKQSQKMLPELQQKESSSLQFLIHELQCANPPGSPKPSQAISKKKLFNSSNKKQHYNDYEEIESLSIEGQIDMNLRAEDLDSVDFLMFEKGFNDEEVEKIERQHMMGEEEL